MVTGVSQLKFLFTRLHSRHRQVPIQVTDLFFLLFSTAVKKLKILIYYYTINIIFIFIISESENKTIIKNKNIMYQNLNNWPLIIIIIIIIIQEGSLNPEYLKND